MPEATHEQIYIPLCFYLNYCSVPLFYNLHSTMFLLNHIDVKNAPVATRFTFHYVSIKSMAIIIPIIRMIIFTFHYVSIKSVG